MKKFPKTPAIIGGALGVISIVISLISLLTMTVSYISMDAGAGNLIMMLARSVIGIVLTALLVLVLFRGKKDLFAGICLGVNGLYALISLFGAVISLLAGTGYFLYSNIEAIVRALVLLLMAVDCFADLPVDRQVKTLLFAGGMALYYVLDILLYGIMMLSYGDPANAVVMLIAYLLPTIPAIVANVCLALCVGGAKQEAPTAQRTF